MSKREASPIDRALIARALEEDIGFGDLTTLATVPAEQAIVATIITRQPGVIAGLDIAAAVFQTVDASLHVEQFVDDGAKVAANDRLARIEGSARSILTAERTALNFLGRLSGIATLTAACVAAIAGTQAAIIDTRKMTPGLRALEKYAVRMGGGRNHRFALDDGILIKDNHIAAAGGVGVAVARARQHAPHLLKIEVECETLEQVQQALDAGADVILLDNMSIGQQKEAVAVIRQRDARVLIEASGNIGTNPERLAAEAATGVDFISLGALTHSAPNFDVSLEYGDQ
ncbi:MAG TPA: carboxylating nicotinate-nucleotide diphosphorylase [Ktedonobacterales bacterium]|nr:carboxylating nicotinate-nucleotide diphosphorylase [Ktedonobacterales bacterium]